jgi:glutaredoxin-related protein
MNVELNKSNENLKTTIHSKIYDRQKKLENVEFFKYLGSMLTNVGRCNCKI